MTKTCRICLAKCHIKYRISPCKCNGSMKWVHRDCLQTWVDQTQSNFCGVCRQTYNTTMIQYNNDDNQWFYITSLFMIIIFVVIIIQIYYDMQITNELFLFNHTSTPLDNCTIPQCREQTYYYAQIYEFVTRQPLPKINPTIQVYFSHNTSSVDEQIPDIWQSAVHTIICERLQTVVCNAFSPENRNKYSYEEIIQRVNKYVIQHIQQYIRKIKTLSLVVNNEQHITENIHAKMSWLLSS